MYKSSLNNNEDENQINDYDVLFLTKKLNISFEEMNQMKYSDLVSILLQFDQDNITRKATQKDFDNF